MNPTLDASDVNNVEIYKKSVTADAKDNVSPFSEIFTCCVYKDKASETLEVAYNPSAEECKNNEFPTGQPAQINNSPIKMMMRLMKITNLKET